MPSLEEVKKYRAEMYTKSSSLIDKKGADYNRDQQQAGDTLFNLKVAEILGIVETAEQGILVRLSDKFMRVISLSKPGREPAVVGESLEDSIADIHNYIDYLGLIWSQRRDQNQQPGMPEPRQKLVLKESEEMAELRRKLERTAIVGALGENYR